MELIAIAAVAANRVIGRSGDIPWSIPEDWKRFKAVTMGSNLIMGRVTFEAIGDPLPGRTSIVITRNPPPGALPAGAAEPGDGAVAGPAEARVAGPADAAVAEPDEATRPNFTRVIWVTSLEESLAAADPSRPAYVAGGAEIYRLAWERLTRLDLTEVDLEPEGDALFPEVDPIDWVEVSRDQREGFAFVEYRRRS